MILHFFVTSKYSTSEFQTHFPEKPVKTSGFSKKIFKAKQTTIFQLAYFDMEMKILQKPTMKIILDQVFPILFKLMSQEKSC